MIRGPLQFGRFANDLSLTKDYKYAPTFPEIGCKLSQFHPKNELKDVMIKLGAHENEIGTIVNTKMMEMVLEELKIPFNTTFEIRPPIVTIVGHIDHGKTTLLDYLRRSSVALGEVGGITQKIGAFTCDSQLKFAEVILAKDSSGNRICFVDTPGHFAFHSSRSRGVQVTDIILLIIAADDGIMEQTIECIKLAKAASTPLIIAITKMDKVKRDSIKIQHDLIRYGYQTKALGGTYECVEVSARTGFGMTKLLDAITNCANEQNLFFTSTQQPFGFILDCNKDKIFGITTSAILKSGEISVGNVLETSTSVAKVKILIDENGNKIRTVGPSTPVKIIGWKAKPSSGEIFEKASTDNLKKLIKQRKTDETNQARVNFTLNDANYDSSNLNRPTLDDLDISELSFEDLKKSYSTSNPLQFSLIIKADSQGSLDAVIQSLGMCQDLRVKLKLEGCGLGSPTTEDLLTSKESKCPIYCFNVPLDDLSSFSETGSKHLFNFDIIYQLLDKVKADIEEKLGESINVKQIGQAFVQKVFKFTGKNRQIVAGCHVSSGTVITEGIIKCKILRENEVIATDKIKSLKSFKREVRRINEGNDCGIIFEKFTDFHENDIIQIFEISKERVPLEWTL